MCKKFISQSVITKPITNEHLTRKQFNSTQYRYPTISILYHDAIWYGGHGSYTYSPGYPTISGGDSHVSCDLNIIVKLNF